MADKPTYSFNGSKEGGPPNRWSRSYPNGTVYEKDTDYVSFEFKNMYFLQQRSTTTKGNARRDNRRINELQSAGLAHITMYMPEDLGVEYGATWGGKGFTNTGADALRGAGSLISAGGDVGQVVRTLLQQLVTCSSRSEALID